MKLIQEIHLVDNFNDLQTIINKLQHKHLDVEIHYKPVVLNNLIHHLVLLIARSGFTNSTNKHFSLKPDDIDKCIELLKDMHRI